MKPLMAYAALVGLPLAGLAAVLHAGRGLHAPPSIAGEWRVDAPALAAALGVGESDARVLRIGQSGTHVTVGLAGRELRGRLREDSLTARYDVGFTPAACMRLTGLELRARIDGAAEPARLDGMLSAPHTGCTPVAVSAMRIQPRRSESR